MRCSYARRNIVACNTNRFRYGCGTDDLLPKRHKRGGDRATVNVQIPVRPPRCHATHCTPVIDSQATPPAISEFTPEEPPVLDDFDPSSVFTTDFGGGGASSLAVAESAIVAPGYIESAPIQNRFRVRYDNFQNANKPTRGGFLYPQLADGGNFTGGRGPDGLGGILSIRHRCRDTFVLLRVCI